MYQFQNFQAKRNILPLLLLLTQNNNNKNFEGGDGVIRHIQFRRPLHLSVLTGKHIHVPTFLNLTTSFIERRVFSPYGLHGGESTSSFFTNIHQLNIKERRDL